MDPHLESVPSIGTLTTRGLTDYKLKKFCRHTNWTRALKTSTLGFALELSTKLLCEKNETVLQVTTQQIKNKFVDDI